MELYSSHCLFLSHAGVDSEAALRLADRLCVAAEAAGHSLKVWVDKSDLAAGGRWKDTLQDALAASTAFAVYVGSRGVVNWVWDEVSIALDRAHREPGYPLVPVLAPGARREELPSFLTQFQGIGDPDNPEELRRLLRAVLRLEPRASVTLVRDPFVGLRAYGSGEAHLFFGRERETEEVVDLVRRRSLVLVTGDSGSGKSSLVRAGLVPAFRGARLGRAVDNGPDQTIWHVLETRPGIDPFGNLADHVREAAERIGVSPSRASDLADLVRTRNPDKVRDAVLSGAPRGEGRATKILVVVDQFEEFRMSPQAGAYVATLLRLATLGDEQIRVVLTMRRDYLYACDGFLELRARLVAGEPPTRFLLGRMSREGLRAAITRPLELAAIGEGDREDLARTVLRDVCDAPGELALLQMALWRTWAKAGGRGPRLVPAYDAIGRVEGALAQAAEEVFGRLSREDRGRAETLFVRLVRPGEAGGATRRVAQLAEFDEHTQTLARNIADEKQWRLLVVQEATVEIAHEQLATQWQRYQRWIANLPGDPEHGVAPDHRGDDLRLLQSLIADATRWALVGSEKRAQAVAAGPDLELYATLADRRATWLSNAEHQFVATSLATSQADLRRTRRIGLLIRGLAAVATIIALVASGLAKVAWQLRDEAELQKHAAESNASAEKAARAEALAARDNAERARNDSIDFAINGLLAESGFLRQIDSGIPWSDRRALAPILESLRLNLEQTDHVLPTITTAMRHWVAHIQKSEDRNVNESRPATAPIAIVSRGVVVARGNSWQLVGANGDANQISVDVGSPVTSLASNQSSLFVSSADGKLRSYSPESGELIDESPNRLGRVVGLAVLRDSVLVFTEDGELHLFTEGLMPATTATQTRVRRVLAISPRGDMLVGTGPAGVYNVRVDAQRVLRERHLQSVDFIPNRAAFSRDGRMIALPAPAGGITLVDQSLDLVIEREVGQARRSGQTRSRIVSSAFLSSSGQLEVLLEDGSTARINLNSPRDRLDEVDPAMSSTADIYSVSPEAWGTLLLETDASQNTRASGTGWLSLTLRACRLAAWAPSQWLTPLEAKAREFCLVEIPRRMDALPPFALFPHVDAERDLLESIVDKSRVDQLLSAGTVFERFLPHRTSVPERNLSPYRLEHGIEGQEANLNLARSIYSEQAEMGDSFAAYRLGRLNIGQFETQSEAVRLLRIAHEAGVIGAANSLGLAYMDGTGVVRDRNVAEGLFQDSIRRGDRVLAPFNLARMFTEQDRFDSQKALRYYRMAVDGGNPYAATALVRSAMRGIFSSLEDTDRLQLLQFAARFDGAASLLLADMIEAQSGGITAVVGEVQELYLKAAIAGIPQGLSYLGRLFERTRTADRAIIAELYRRAVVAGDRSAGGDLARLLREAGANADEISHWYRLGKDYSSASALELPNFGNHRHK